MEGPAEMLLDGAGTGIDDWVPDQVRGIETHEEL